jgi:alpha-glucuronidase
MRSLRLVLLLATAAALRAEDGYRLWLRYDRVADEGLRAAYAAGTREIRLSTPAGAESPTLAAAREELTLGLAGLLGTTTTTVLSALPPDPALGADGFRLRRSPHHRMEIRANGDLGLLYGVFALLREFQTQVPPGRLEQASAPRIERRILDHWDNLDGFVERGYAGSSLWNWADLPGKLDPRYRDYARANASIGINGVTLTNVNADPRVLTAPYLAKAAALADVFRPYGLRVYLAARFSAPMDIGGMRTADPRDPAVAAWWRAKANEIYRAIPDFGGFLVKANSEGEPGPQDYGCSHADGANLLADAVAPHGGIVLWRAFVYSPHDANDRTKQAYHEFQPLDGRFRANVLLQIKNGPLDFQPREPFHPLFGAMPHTHLALEVQLTQEYLGQATFLAYLGPLYQECLESRTYRPDPNATVASVIEGSGPGSLSAIAGVANIGSDRDWTGHPLSAANWYAFGRLAWDPTRPSAAIAEEWVRQSFSNTPRVVRGLSAILMASRPAVVDGTMPLGLHHIMARGHHYGPGPWVEGGRPDWTAVYYHKADAGGLGFDRTASGSDALAQYAPEVARAWGDLATCPDDLLLWFHHVPWDYRMRSGRPMWDELCLRYQRGFDEVQAMARQWDALRGLVDPERFARVAARFRQQAEETAVWRDGCLQYFQQFSRRPLPPGVPAPAHDLAFYEAIDLRPMPGDPSGR